MVPFSFLLHSHSERIWANKQFPPRMDMIKLNGCSLYTSGACVAARKLNNSQFQTLSSEFRWFRRKLMSYEGSS